ncbi:MAG TPA: PilC/PilY family type IV pilus protein [Thermoanaerobaculia bacterium]|jgi:hypothetical protein|nr:PilC/PilY family type IV pilus protein [Thermoanaerobaculia bacterium]
MSTRPRCFDRTAVRVLAAAALLGLLGGGTMRGDDRDLLRTGVGDPYLFILLDTSGSMNWAPPSPAGDASCTNGDCYEPFQADDPKSKFYQAKDALYETLIDPAFPKAHLGFATYNQDALVVHEKHWLYQANDDGISLGGGEKYPVKGGVDVFGSTWTCTNSGTGDYQVGCTFNTPARLSDSWEAARVQRLPKVGLTFDLPPAGQTAAQAAANDFFIKSLAGQVYRVRYTAAVAGTYGQDLSVSVAIWLCLRNPCTPTTSIQATSLGTKTVVFTSPKDAAGNPAGDFLSWDDGGNALKRTSPGLTYFKGVNFANDSNEGGDCNGWDSNADDSLDTFNQSSPSASYDLRFPTTLDPRGPLFSAGDMLPFDWNTDHKADILKRLAPNNPSPPDASKADFRIATYLNDNRQGSDTFLRLKNEGQRPLIPSGNTPIGNSFEAFREWYVQWADRARDSSQVDYDTSFECRNKYLLILTDGDETCGAINGPNGQPNDPCTVAAQLRAMNAANPNLKVTVFVVAFGVQAASGNKLSCIADADHTFYPQTKDELIQDLKTAFGLILEDQRAFASAAVPSVQAEVADRIFLSSFRPIKATGTSNPDAFVWDGHLDAYLKPLPLANGKPDTSKACPAPGSPNRSSCHLWDAGAVMLGQAPNGSDIASPPDQSSLKLGLGADQRRVFYPQANSGSGIPSTLRLFYPPTVPNTGILGDTGDWRDLWRGFKLTDPATATAASSIVSKVDTIIKEALRIKTATVHPSGGSTLNIRYVLGDIFHADPVLVDRPNDFFSFAADTSQSTDCKNDSGYRCFSRQQRHRRKLLLVGADDGQLHALDAGVWEASTKTFSDGTGTEVFSYMPRLAMPIVRDQMVPSGGTPHQIFGVDSTPRLKDVFIDPSHGGTPDATQREWRTVAIGGFRDGGSIDGGASSVKDFVSGYYALDVTQPDQLDPNVPVDDRVPIDDRVVPSCISLTNQVVSNCGTLPFPSVLWEFTDSLNGSRLDEDVAADGTTPAPNGAPDLGQTWSVPTIGRIRVKVGTDTVEKFVAIFGGGLDSQNKSNPKSGTWLYMVDIETGRTLYKQPLDGAVPSDVAAIDVDLDGILDTIYVGTTNGFLYKVDMKTPVTLETVTLAKNRFIPNLAASVDVQRITNDAWKPFKIFDTGGKPIYLAPTAFFVSRLDKFALAFGTGDREALLNEDDVEGRFYLIVDDNFTATTSGLPKHDVDYQQIQPGDNQAADGTDFVLNPAPSMQRGWFVKLPANEKVITQAFGLSGIVIFSSFTPDSAPCSNGGSSHIFVVFANNGNAVMTTTADSSSGPAGTPIRFRTVNSFVTNPYVEQGQTKNSPAGSGSVNSEDLDAQQKAILNTLKKFFPKGTKFANYWISVSGVRSDTGYERYATIPVGIVERNWKEQ